MGINTLRCRFEAKSSCGNQAKAVATSAPRKHAAPTVPTGRTPETLDPDAPVRHGATGPYLIGCQLRKAGQFTSGQTGTGEPRSFRLDQVELD